MIWIVAALLFAAAAWGVLRWFAHADPALVKRGLAGFALVFLVGVTLVLAFTGRISAAAPFLFGSFIAYQRLRTGLGLAQFLKRLWDASRGKTTPQGRVLSTPYLTVQLDDSDAVVGGAVSKGVFKGLELGALGPADLTMKYDELCRLDARGAQLLDVYLCRVIGPDWQHRSDAGRAQAHGPLTLKQAADVLGVPLTADEKSVRAAHKRLMKTAHPDRGGSEYLAQQINAAKDVLLKSRV